jgi:hypothetical protein
MSRRIFCRTQDMRHETRNSRLKIRDIRHGSLKSGVLSLPLELLISIFLLIASIYPAGRAHGDQRKSDYLTPASIKIVSGDHQSGGAGMALAAPLVVEVLDLGLRPLPAAKVEFTVVAGGGTVGPGGAASISVDTDRSGRASVTLILGKTREVNMVKVRAGEADPVTFTATVISSPPSLEPIGDKQVDEGAMLSFTVSATDPDPEDTVTLSVSALPSNASFDPSTGVFTFTPDHTQSGVYPVTFTASDGSLTDSEEINITVRDVNRSPVLNPIGNQSVDENDEIVIAISATDPDGDALSFSASGMPSGAVLQQQQGEHGGSPLQCTFTWTPGLDVVTCDIHCQ